MKSAALAVVLASVLVPPSLSAAPAPGWLRVDVAATGSYFWRYVPASLDTSQPAPLVLFLHGAGGKPDNYRSFISGAAEKAGCVLAMPKSFSNLGWGFGEDEETVSETLRLAAAELPVDERRVAIAGHSAGGAYAYLLAYAGSRYSAVFTLAASFYTVNSLADTSYKPPIRMYYSGGDLNYTGGAYANLKAQWNRLGVPWEEDLQSGYGHNNWPPSSMENGFLFLAGKSRPASLGSCTPTATSLCLNRGRFRVEVTWHVDGAAEAGKVVPGAAADSGLFWFFGESNWELMVKVLDGCTVNGHYWVYAASATDVRYVLTVTDTANGEVARYEHSGGRPAPATTDTEAFPACP